MAVVGAKPSNALLSHPEGRRAALSSLALLGGWQIKHTPWPLVESMVDLAGKELPRMRVLVLFNLEFLEVLHARHGDAFMRGQVTFVADTPLEKMFAERVYGVKAWLPNLRTWDKIMDDKKRDKSRRALEKLMAKLNAPVDLTFTNPPYNGGTDLKILLGLIAVGLLRRVVCVHPSTWLVDVKTQLGPKTGNPLFRKFQDAVGTHLKSVHLFNGNPVFGIGLFVPCVVTDMDMGWARQQGVPIKVKDVGQEEYREVFGLEDITLHGKDWDPTVKEFMGRVQKLCTKNGSVLDNKKVYSTSIHNSTCIQLAGIRGNVSTNTMTDEDFYTFVQRNPIANKGLRKKDDRMIVLDTATAAEQDNLLNYLQTDFARLCLSLLKLKGDLDRGELSLVPWLDFTRSWNDDQLFAMLGYPKGHPIREYAKRFLPDYHNIYPNGKTY